MANSISKEELEDLEVTNYNDIRDTLESGDLLFASGNYWVSKAIRKVTESPWSHVGIIFNVRSLDRVLLLESVEDMGVRFAPLSKYIKDYDGGKPYRGEVVVARAGGINTDIMNDLARHGIDELTMPYDKDEVAKILARVAMGRGKWKKDREYICSELVYECFDRAGKTFELDKRGFISPENIWQDSSVEFLHRVL